MLSLQKLEIYRTVYKLWGSRAGERHDIGLHFAHNSLNNNQECENSPQAQQHNPEGAAGHARRVTHIKFHSYCKYCKYLAKILAGLQKSRRRNRTVLHLKTKLHQAGEPLHQQQP